jgi:hypothetical protein
VQECLSANLVTITDSLFPCYIWLFAAGYSRTRVADFSQQLAQLLHPLQPLIIYLNSDVALGLNRAVAQRGRRWLDDLMATMQSYTYCQTHPVQDSGDVVAFFKATSQLSSELLADWPHPILKLDTTTTPLDQLATLLLDQFNLSKQEAAAMPAPNELQRYVGVYVSRDTTTARSPLEIRLIDNELLITRYWPNGCRLIAGGAGRFRLQSTNRHITFDTQAPEKPGWLAYTYGGREYFCDRISKL